MCSVREHMIFEYARLKEKYQKKIKKKCKEESSMIEITNENLIITSDQKISIVEE